MDALGALAADGARKALVVGGGFIGLEAAENLRRRGLEVTVVQHSGHVLPSIDREMAWLLGAELASDGVEVRLNAELTGFRKEGDSLYACLKDGSELAADLVVMSVGVKPNSELAGAAGLELGPRGHIVVNEYLQTSDPDIYAAGDAVEVTDCVSGRKTAIPLAGPANRQGRIGRRQHRRKLPSIPRQLGGFGDQGREPDGGGRRPDRNKAPGSSDWIITGFTRTRLPMPHIIRAAPSCI